MPKDLIRAVAELKCRVPHSDRGSDGPPECCYGTGLRFPELSREVEIPRSLTPALGEVGVYD